MAGGWFARQSKDIRIIQEKTMKMPGRLALVKPLDAKIPWRLSGVEF
jgi:hypothetical protein